MRILVKLIVAAYFAIAIPPASAENHMAEFTVVATVNATEITLGHTILVHEGILAQYQSLPDDQLFQGIVKQLIHRTLLCEISDNADCFRVQLTIDNDRGVIRAFEVVGFISFQAIGEDDIAAVCKANFFKIQLERKFNITHVTVLNEESAPNLIKKVKDGSDFAKLAREYSPGPSGYNGGQLGWFQKASMVPPFDEAAIAIEKGAIYGPLTADFGWHAVKFYYVRDLSAPPVEQVRDALFAELQQKTVLECISHLQDNSDIARIDLGEFDTDVLSDPGLLRH